MFRLTAVIVFSLSCAYLNVAQQVQQNTSDLNTSTDDVIQFMQNRTLLDINSAQFCETPRRCVPYGQCRNDGTFDRQGINMLNPRFSSDGSNTILHGNEVYPVTVDNTIITRSGEIKPVCQFYERCCGEISITKPDLAPNKTTIVPANRPTGCGFSNPDGIGFKITNTDKAQFGEYPWMVAVMWKNPPINTPELAGGGSLINPNVILTAAHILGDRKSNEIKVRAGEWDTQSESETLRHQERNVKQIIQHNEFHNLALEYDYALLVVDVPFNLDEHIQPICLPTTNLYFDYTECYSAGWGKIDFLHQERRQSIMKKVILPVVPFETCQDTLRKTQLGDIFVLHDSFICAGGVAGKDTCTGDGGSPLMCPVYNELNRYYHVGTVAWGLSCGLHNVPGVYANVALVRGWIDLKMKELGFDDSSYKTS